MHMLTDLVPAHLGCLTWVVSSQLSNLYCLTWLSPGLYHPGCLTWIVSPGGKTIVCVRQPLCGGPLGQCHVWVQAGDSNPRSYAYWYSVLPLYYASIMKSIPKAYLT